MFYGMADSPSSLLEHGTVNFLKPSTYSMVFRIKFGCLLIFPNESDKTILRPSLSSLDIGSSVLIVNLLPKIFFRKRY